MRLVYFLSKREAKRANSDCLNEGVDPKILWQTCGTNLDKSVSTVYSYL
jgi:hypothetical protein